MNTELSRNANLGLLFIRIGVGIVFVVSGWFKFMDIAGTTDFFQKIGLAQPFVYFIAVLELLGGLALLLGIWTRVFGSLLAIEILVALFLVKYAMGFNAYRIDLALFFSALGLAFTGAGGYSLCRGKCEVGAKEKTN